MSFLLKSTFALIALFATVLTPIQANAKSINVAVGWSKPPYVIQDSHSGFELELVRRIFAAMGHEVNYIYIPYGRSGTVLKDGEVDAVLTVNEKTGIEKHLLSDVYIHYQNVAVSLKEKKLMLYWISDLSDYAVVAFQNASRNLGEDFSNAVAKSRLYIELPDQQRQVNMLLQGNADVVVMDVNIFNHLSRISTGENQMGKVDVHYLFPKSGYRVGFKQPDMRVEFDKALAQVLQSDDYQALLQKYDFTQSLLANSVIERPQLNR